MVSSNNISSSCSMKSRFVLTHIDSEMVSFEQEEEINDTENTSEFKNLTDMTGSPEVKELPSWLDRSSSQSKPSTPDNSQYVNDVSEQLLKLFCDKSVSLVNVYHLFEHWLELSIENWGVAGSA